jgi:hypothetical protein
MDDDELSIFSIKVQGSQSKIKSEEYKTGEYFLNESGEEREGMVCSFVAL